jgi:hypothetical protein
MLFSGEIKTRDISQIKMNLFIFDVSAIKITQTIS